MPDIEACAVAGTLAAGVDCVHTLSTTTESLDLIHTIRFLEAQAGGPDPLDSTKTIAPHGAAIIISAADWVKIETTIQTACLKINCSYEVTAQIQSITSKIDSLQKFKR